MASKAGLELAQKLLGIRSKSGGFDRLLEKIKITEAGCGNLIAEMKVDKEHSNLLGYLHGGMTTFLVDTLSGIALMTSDSKFQNPGVSLNINMTFLKAALVGQEILIKASTDKVGSRIAFLSVDILNKSTSEVIAKGSHIKFIGNATGATKDKSQKFLNTRVYPVSRQINME